MRRFIFASIGIFLLIVLLIWLIAARSTRPSQSTSVRKSVALMDIADTSAEVRFTHEGRVNARENRRVLQIVVSATQRRAVLYEGYGGKIIKSETHLNDQDAYRAFLSALHNSGYTQTRQPTRNIEPIGACPMGARYHYDVIGSDDSEQSLWSTSCESARGTFGGSASAVRGLFRAQLPDYNEFMRGVTF